MLKISVFFCLILICVFTGCTRNTASGAKTSSLSSSGGGGSCQISNCLGLNKEPINIPGGNPTLYPAITDSYGTSGSSTYMDTLIAHCTTWVSQTNSNYINYGCQSVTLSISGGYNADGSSLSGGYQVEYSCNPSANSCKATSIAGQAIPPCSSGSSYNVLEGCATCCQATESNSTNSTIYFLADSCPTTTGQINLSSNLSMEGFSSAGFNNCTSQYANNGIYYYDSSAGGVSFYNYVSMNACATDQNTDIGSAPGSCILNGLSGGSVCVYCGSGTDNTTCPNNSNPCNDTSNKQQCNPSNIWKPNCGCDGTCWN